MADPSNVDPAVRDCLRRYWRSNLIIMAVLLALWAAAGLGCGVLWADHLNAWRIGGIPLGFWFAQQGSILAFVLLIFVYAVLLNRLDRKHRDELARLRGRREGGDA